MPTSPSPPSIHRRSISSFLRKNVSYATNEGPGTIVVDPANHFLYHVEERRQGNPLWRRSRPRRLPLGWGRDDQE